MDSPYITAEYLDRKTRWSADAFNFDQSTYDQTVQDVLESESERIRGYVGAPAHFDDAVDESDIHPVIKAELVTLCRHALSQINEQGLSSSNSGDGSSHSYRPSQEIRDSVRREVQNLDLDDGNEETDASSYVDVI